MKTSVLITLVFGFLTTSLCAQEKIWLDSNWNVSTKENASYYRPVPQKKDNGFWIVDYYKSGKKQMEGFSFNTKLNEEKFEGLVIYYHENEAVFQKVFYEKGKPVGKFSEFYDTGEVKRMGKYEEGKRKGVWKEFYKNGKIEKKGKYKNGEKVGVWKTFYKNVD